MVQMIPRRGRPKGTGIDDSDRLARLTELLRHRPEMRPTTAIRLMGFSDPSAIRRLRDKYKELTSTELAPATERIAVPDTVAAIPVSGSQLAAPLGIVR